MRANLMKAMAIMGVMCLMFAASLTAQANVITDFGKERLEKTSKVLTKVVPQKEGEEAPTCGAGLHNARKLIEAYGDEATEIFQKHGKMGGELLNSASGAAELMDKLPEGLPITLKEWVQEGKLTFESTWEIVKWCGQHPVAATFMCSCGSVDLLRNPTCREVVGTVCDAGSAVIYFVHHFPVMTVIIALILIGLMIFFRKKIKAGISALLCLPVRLLRWFFRKCFPKQEGEKRESV